MMGMTELIIFDCDGTLVDSEWLYNSITAELLNELGFDEYTPEQFSCSESQTNTISPHFKRISLSNSTSNLNHGHLDNEGRNSNSDKQPISADSFKDVE